MQMQDRSFIDRRVAYEGQIPWIIGFGLLWGGIELFLGAWLKQLQPALFGINMPFVVGVLLLIAKYFVPGTGSLLLMAIIAAPLKFFFTGLVLHGAFMAILLEALLAELLFLILGLRLVTFLGVATAIQLYSAVHPWLSKGVFCQSTHFVFFKRWIEQAWSFGNPIELSDSFTGILLFSAHVSMGIVAGFLAWGITRLLPPKLTRF